MGELVERAFTEQRLLEAWSEVRDAALADGDAGPEVERFEAAAARHVSELAEALGGGTFQPHPVGFLHWARWGRPCLALDLIEEFRPVIVDAMVLRCLAAGIVRFEESETTPGLGCRMNARARQAFLAACERRMLTIFTHEPTGRRVSYRVGIGLQAKALAAAILDPGRPYRPVRWK